MKKRLLYLLVLLVLGVTQLKAQEFVVKTNLLDDITTTPNLGVEIGLGKKTTLDLSAMYNPWTFSKKDNRKMKHVVAQPEFRYWFCERFNGHFIGAHGIYTEYNVSAMKLPKFLSKNADQHRFQGWAAGAGLVYGYQWIIAPRWNLEASIGLGWLYTVYDKYECTKCGKWQGNQDKHYFGPTKAAVSLIYIIK